MFMYVGTVQGMTKMWFALFPPTYRYLSIAKHKKNLDFCSFSLFLEALNLSKNENKICRLLHAVSFYKNHS